MSPATITALQAVAVALLVLLGQVAVARLSKKAAEAPVEVDAQAKATDAWQKYAEKMETRLDLMDRRLLEAEAREEDNRRRIAALERQSERDKDLIRRLLGRLRRALDEVQRLGGRTSEADLEVLDLADTRLEL